MNRFFRSALFPLVVIVLLVYLASQTLMPRKDSDQKLTYSQLIDETKKGNVSEVNFNPNRQAITAAGTGCSAAIDAERWLAETATGTTQTTDTDLIGAQQ